MQLPASLCLYCGSRSGRNPAFSEAAAELGAWLANNQVRLIYGGGHVGLMGTAADACLAAGGEVVGVIPKFLLEREVGHLELTRLEIVESMHERKTRMASLAEAFCVLPGGLGTLEELFEVLTWRQLGLHTKPVVLLDIDGYWTPLLGFLKNQAEAGFMEQSALGLLRPLSSVSELPRALAQELTATADLSAKWG